MILSRAENRLGRNKRSQAAIADVAVLVLRPVRRQAGCPQPLLALPAPRRRKKRGSRLRRRAVGLLMNRCGRRPSTVPTATHQNPSVRLNPTTSVTIMGLVLLWPL